MIEQEQEGSPGLDSGVYVLDEVSMTRFLNSTGDFNPIHREIGKVVEFGLDKMLPGFEDKKVVSGMYLACLAMAASFNSLDLAGYNHLKINFKNPLALKDRVGIVKQGPEDDENQQYRIRAVKEGSSIDNVIIDLKKIEPKGFSALNSEEAVKITRISDTDKVYNVCQSFPGISLLGLMDNSSTVPQMFLVALLAGVLLDYSSAGSQPSSPSSPAGIYSSQEATFFTDPSQFSCAYAGIDFYVNKIKTRGPLSIVRTDAYCREEPVFTGRARVINPEP